MTKSKNVNHMGTPLPYFVKYVYETRVTPAHYLVTILFYDDEIKFKYSTDTPLYTFIWEARRLHDIFHTKDSVYNGTHPENKLRELKLFKSRNYKRNYIFKLEEWNFYEKDYLLN
jgi:hypothetical protein